MTRSRSARLLLRATVATVLLALAGCVYGPGYYGGYGPAPYPSYGYYGAPVVIGGGWGGGWHSRGWR